MAPTSVGSPDGPAPTQGTDQPTTGDAHALTIPAAQVRCDLCRGDHPQPNPDGRVDVVVCPAHTGVLNRAGNAAAGLDPGQEDRDYGHLSGLSPALAALLPADGPHYRLTLPDVTALAMARVLDVTLP